ncbi:unnamed protein product [Adineta ricciae]|uniref:G-protein coupled receptors family 1 profile domain-containing protein n=1 Tax=Adineta ricciae TaxID=249248 RepID=A0A815FDH0_ADIRI|nr:unnamed protein product [Adineta ricciae]
MVTNNQHMSIILQSIDTFSHRVQVTDSLCWFLIVLGVLGNLFGLLIFCSSQQAWRISTIYVYLASSTSIINLFCAIRYALILHSKSRIFINNLVGYSWYACKIYEMAFSFRVISSWITLFWMFERLICISDRLRTLFHRWNTSQLKIAIPLVILSFILIGTLAPSVYIYQPQTIENESTSNTSRDLIHYYCGLSSNASLKWKKYFFEVRLGFNHHTVRCFFSELFPAVAIVAFNICILYSIYQTTRQLKRTSEHKMSKKRRKVTSWMNLILILHSSLFLFSLFSHIAGHIMTVEAHETWWVLLSVLGNCSLNFYIYCLSGRHFRWKTVRLIKFFFFRIIYQIEIWERQWKERQRNFRHRENYPLKTGLRLIPMNSSSV